VSLLGAIKRILQAEEREPREPIGGNMRPRVIEFPVGEIETVRLGYEGSWYEVERGPDGLSLREEREDD